jgi:hypothetical protein
MFYYSYIAFPIVGVFLIGIIVMIIVLIVKRNNRQDEIIEIRREEAPLEVVNVEMPGNILQSNQMRNAQIVHNAQISQEVHPHPFRCVFNDSNQTFWKLNCGGLVCNECIINFSTAMLSSEVVTCPLCSSPVYHFCFVNERGEQACVIDDNVNDLDTSLVCKICFERPAERRLDCQSTSGHYICEFCYQRLVEVQKILLCPFCRTLIRKNFNEEQAPVVLSMQ